jgi:hypothetical protein
VAQQVKVRKVSFNMLTLGRTARSVGFWFCVWIASRLAFDLSVAVTGTVWLTSAKVINAIQIIRDTILAG